MNRTEKCAIGLLVSFLVGIAVGAGTLWAMNLSATTSTGEEAAEEQDTTETQDTTPDPETTYPDFALQKEVAVYLVWWDQDNGFENIKQNTDKISRVSPFWYQMKADGSIEKFSGAEDEEIIEFCKDNGIKITPVISNEHDPEPIQAVFADTTLTTQHIENIADIVETNDYDGIEIDYESMEATDRENYSSFMTSLSTKLHENGRILTTAVHAKTTDQGTWGGPAAQDWNVLGDVCDEVKIMTYDFHWATSEAGDIAPLGWMDDVYEYAVTVMPKEKIFVGVHFYGYDWVDEQGTDLTYDVVEELIETYSPTIQTSREGEKYFTYSKDGEGHTVYYADSEVVAARIALATEYDVAGIGIWRIGKEDPNNWTAIGTAFGE